MLAAALDYAGRGWRVFPCAGKRPRTAHGYKDASTSADRITEWWKRWPDADIAIATGGGLVVLDVGRRDRAPTLHELKQPSGSATETVAAETGGGGMHFYFTSEQRIRNSAGKLGVGLDIRGDGGYVIAPPSVHPSGRRYAWDVEPGETPPAPLPAWLGERDPTGTGSRVPQASGVSSSRTARRWVSATTAPPPSPATFSPVTSTLSSCSSSSSVGTRSGTAPHSGARKSPAPWRRSPGGRPRSV